MIGKQSEQIQMVILDIDDSVKIFSQKSNSVVW